MPPDRRAAIFNAKGEGMAMSATDANERIARFFATGWTKR